MFLSQNYLSLILQVFIVNMALDDMFPYGVGKGCCNSLEKKYK
jgi:hypothetical protein